MKQIVLAATLLIFSAVSVHAQNDSEEEIPEDEEVNLSRDDEKDVSLPSGEVGKYVVIPKAGGRDWAILLDTQTGETWRLGHQPAGTSGNRSGDRWVWMPINVCADCR